MHMLAEQDEWLEAHCRGPYLAGPAITIADLTWFPTCVFMEFMLPRFFGWPQLFDANATAPTAEY